MAHNAASRAAGANNTPYSPVPSVAMEAPEANGSKAAAAALGTAPATGAGGVEGGRKLFQYLGAGAACMFAACMGTTMGWTSAADRLKNSLSITDTEYSWVGASMPLGAMLAAPCTGPAIARWGRRNSLLALSPITFLAWLLIIFAQNAWMLILARLVIGAAIGAISMTAPLYSNEIAHRSVRGTLGGFFQFLHTCGVLFAYLLAYAIPGDLTPISAIIACVPLLAGICFFFFPDSPAWYMLHDRRDQAKQSLIKFRGSDYPVEKLEAELDEIYQEIKEAQDSKKSTLEAFSTREARLGLALSMNLMLVQQLSGVSAVIFYAGNIFQDAGSSLSAEVSAIIMGACLAGGTLLSLFLVDRLGRRLLLLVSGVSCLICNVVLGTYLYYQKVVLGAEAMKPYGAVPILAMSLFMILFSIGFGPIPWSFMTEVFLTDIRSQAMSVATITNWAMVFIVTLGYDPLQKAVGGYTTFWIFGAIVLASTLVVFFFQIETKGRSPSEIQEALRGKKRVGPRSSGAV